MVRDHMVPFRYIQFRELAIRSLTGEHISEIAHQPGVLLKYLRYSDRAITGVLTDVCCSAFCRERHQRYCSTFVGGADLLKGELQRSGAAPEVCPEIPAVKVGQAFCAFTMSK